MRVEGEGGTAAWLAGTLVAPSVQGHGLTPLQELWPYQESFFEPLVAGDQKASLASLSSYLCQFRHLEGSLAWGPSLLFGESGTRKAPLTGVLLCRWAHQALKGAPWVGSYSVVWHISHLKEPLDGAYSVVQCIRRLMGQPLYCSAADGGMCGEPMVMAPPPTRDSAVSPCFHGCLTFLHRHFPP